MIIFNTTYNITHTVEPEWLEWMKITHIPELQATELISEIKFLKLLTEIENQGVTYTCQLAFITMEDFLTYQMQFQDDLQEKHHQQFKGQYVSFRTLLEEV
jgi:hypothetical protein